MEFKKTFVKRNVGGDILLVPLGDAMYENVGIFVLTEVASFIWDLLPRVQTEEELLQAILDEYDVEEAAARADLEAFLNKLRKEGII